MNNMYTLRGVKRRLEFKMGNFLELLNRPFHPNRHLLFLDAYHYHLFAEDLGIETDKETKIFNEICIKYFGYTWAEIHALMRKHANENVNKLLHKEVEPLSEQEQKALLKFYELFPPVEL